MCSMLRELYSHMFFCQLLISSSTSWRARGCGPCIFSVWRIYGITSGKVTRQRVPKNQLHFLTFLLIPQISILLLLLPLTPLLPLLILLPLLFLRLSNRKKILSSPLFLPPQVTKLQLSTPTLVYIL